MAEPTIAEKQAALIKQARALMKANKAQEADDLLAQADSLTATPEATEPAQPRKPEEVIVDLFTAIHSILGTSPALVPLIAELKDVLKPAAPAAKPSA